MTISKDIKSITGQLIAHIRKAVEVEWMLSHRDCNIRDNLHAVDNTSKYTTERLRQKKNAPHKTASSSSNRRHRTVSVDSVNAKVITDDIQ